VSHLPWEQTEEFIRSGHKDINDFQSDSLRTIWISEKEGIKAVIGKKKGSQTTEVVSYLFIKEKGWTLEKAKKWFEEHENRASHEHLYCLTPILEKIIEKPLKIRGIALSSGISRNLNIYSESELQQFASKLVGSPIYLEHVSALGVVGKVTNATWNPTLKTIFYEAEIYDDETQEKIRKGLIRHVSVAADYERIDNLNGKLPQGLHNAELSLVAVPGIPETNIQITENLGTNPQKPNSTNDEKTIFEIEFEAHPSASVDELIASIEDVVDQINNALSVLDSQIKAIEDKGRVEERKRERRTGRAIIAPEAIVRNVEPLDFSKIRLRDVLKYFS